MKKWRLLSFIFTALMFAGCSTQRYFILSNSTNQTISVRYVLNDPMSEKALFRGKNELYQSKKDYFPNWEHKLAHQDLDSSEHIVLIELKPQTALVFGRLSNENYDLNSKTSELGKVFNLQEMTFTSNGIDYLIDENNFHTYFKKDGGTFTYVIQ